MRLLDEPARIVSGQILFQGRDIVDDERPRNCARYAAAASPWCSRTR